METNHHDTTTISCANSQPVGRTTAFAGAAGGEGASSSNNCSSSPPKQDFLLSLRHLRTPLIFSPRVTCCSPFVSTSPSSSDPPRQEGNNHASVGILNNDPSITSSTTGAAAVATSTSTTATIADTSIMMTDVSATTPPTSPMIHAGLGSPIFSSYSPILTNVSTVIGHSSTNAMNINSLLVDGSIFNSGGFCDSSNSATIGTYHVTENNNINDNTTMGRHNNKYSTIFERFSETTCNYFDGYTTNNRNSTGGNNIHDYNTNSGNHPTNDHNGSINTKGTCCPPNIMTNESSNYHNVADITTAAQDCCSCSSSIDLSYINNFISSQEDGLVFDDEEEEQKEKDGPAQEQTTSISFMRDNVNTNDVNGYEGACTKISNENSSNATYATAGQDSTSSSCSVALLNVNILISSSPDDGLVLEEEEEEEEGEIKETIMDKKGSEVLPCFMTADNHNKGSDKNDGDCSNVTNDSASCNAADATAGQGSSSKSCNIALVHVSNATSTSSREDGEVLEDDKKKDDAKKTSTSMNNDKDNSDNTNNGDGKKGACSNATKDDSSSNATYANACQNGSSNSCSVASMNVNNFMSSLHKKGLVPVEEEKKKEGEEKGPKTTSSSNNSGKDNSGNSNNDDGSRKGARPIITNGSSSCELPAGRGSNISSLLNANNAMSSFHKDRLVLEESEKEKKGPQTSSSSSDICTTHHTPDKTNRQQSLPSAILNHGRDEIETTSKKIITSSSPERMMIDGNGHRRPEIENDCDERGNLLIVEDKAFLPSNRPPILVAATSPHRIASEEFRFTQILREEIDYGDGLIFQKLDHVPENHFLYVPGVRKRPTKVKSKSAQKKSAGNKRKFTMEINDETPTKTFYSGRMSLAGVSVNLGSNHTSSATAAAALDIANKLYWGPNNKRPYYVLSEAEVLRALGAVGYGTLVHPEEFVHSLFTLERKEYFELLVDRALSSLGGRDDYYAEILCGLDKGASVGGDNVSKHNKAAKSAKSKTTCSSKSESQDFIIKETLSYTGEHIIFDIDDEGMFSWRLDSSVPAIAPKTDEPQTTNSNKRK